MGCGWNEASLQPHILYACVRGHEQFAVMTEETFEVDMVPDRHNDLR
jgi:hypothetical protein